MNEPNPKKRWGPAPRWYPLIILAVGLGLGGAMFAAATRPATTLWSQTLTIDGTVTLATQTPTPTPTNTPTPTPTPTATTVAASTYQLSCGTTAAATCVREDSEPGGLNRLQAAGANGSVVLNNPSGEKWVVFRSLLASPIATISSRSGWSVKLNITAISGPAATGSATLWYVTVAAATCGTPPASSATNYIAGATFAPAGGVAVGSLTVPLTAGTAATGVPVSARVLCLRVDRTTGGSFTIQTTGASTLTGPFTP